MPPEERNRGKVLGEVKKSLPGFIVLGLIIVFFIFAMIQDGKGGLKPPNTFTKKNTNAAVMNINDS